MSRRSSKAHMAYVRSFRKNARKRHRKARRNPYPLAGVISANPRRKRRSARRNPVMHRRHRRSGYRRNPSIMGFSLPPLQSVLYAGAGFAGVPLVEGFLTPMLPASVTTTTLGKYGVRIGAVIGLSYLTKMVLGNEAAKMVGIGGGAYVAISAVREFAPGVIPGLSAYGPASLGAYTQQRRTLGAPNFGAQNTATFAPRGAQNIVAARFRRFQ